MDGAAEGGRRLSGIESLTGGGDGFLEAALAPECVAQVAVRLREVRIKLDRPVTRGKGFLDMPLLDKQLITVRIFRSEDQRLAEQFAHKCAANACSPLDQAIPINAVGFQAGAVELKESAPTSGIGRKFTTRRLKAS